MDKVRFTRRRAERWAVGMADILSRVPGIKQVMLTGSLSRPEGGGMVGDIDLIVLHDGSLQDTAFTVRKGRHEHCQYMDEVDKIFTGEEGLETLGGGVLNRYICDVVHCPVDICCADYRVMDDCYFLGRFAAINKDPDFARRVFCEMPLPVFHRELMGFTDDGVLHKNGKCCKPEKSWAVRKKEREAQRSKS